MILRLVVLLVVLCMSLSWSDSAKLIKKHSAQRNLNSKKHSSIDKVTEYYELVDDDEMNCEKRAAGKYPLRDITKYMICNETKEGQTVSCGGTLVYDVEVQKCILPRDMSTAHFCRYRGDGAWDSPWSDRKMIVCMKGFTMAERCKQGFHYDPYKKDCIAKNSLINCFTIERKYTSLKMGCYKRGNLKMEMILNNINGPSKEDNLDWSRFEKSIEGLVCRCAKQAYEGGYNFFAIRLWAECWAGKDQNELDAFLVDQKQRSEQFCYSNITKTDFERCNDADSRICVGSEHGQYVYKLDNVRDERKVTSAESRAF